MRKWALYLIIAFMALATTLCTHPRTSATHAEKARRRSNPYAPLGYTECTELGPVSWLNLRIYGTDEEKPVVSHERKHMEQMRRFPSCADWGEWYKEHKIESEAEAMCESARADMQQTRGLALDGAVYKYSVQLATRYGFDITLADAILKLKEFCG